jgi:hypothetical protein
MIRDIVGLTDPERELARGSAGPAVLERFTNGEILLCSLAPRTLLNSSF